MNIDYPHILDIIKDYNLAGRTESAAFLMWYLENYYRLDPEEAIDSVCDQNGDKGIDGIYINEANGTIDVFQSKISQKPGRTIGDKSLREFLGSISQLKTKDTILNLIETAGDNQVSSLVKRLDLYNNIDAYTIRGVFVCNSEIDANGKDFSVTIDDFEFVGKTDIESTYISTDKNTSKAVEAKFNVESTSITKYFVDTETLVIIAPIQANELIKMTGIADQSIFAYNVRGPLGNTKVNKDIVKSIKNSAFHKQFPLFHNGITIVSNELLNTPDDEITIKTFFVVNGCQSLTALFRNKTFLTDDLNILVKFIKVDVNSDLSKTITKFSNNQNGVKARDFKSNNAIQIRLQNEINQYYPSEFFYEIQRGEDSNGINVISNEQSGIRLMAFDLKEPWNTRRKYQVFDEKYNEIFARPEVDGHRIVLLEIIENRIQAGTPKIKNPLVANYGMTKYTILYIVRKIMEADEFGLSILSLPSSFVSDLDNRKKLIKVLDRLIDDIIIDLNGEIDMQGEGFDYKSRYRDKEWIENISREIVSNHQKLVQRNRVQSLRQEYES